MAQLKNQNTQKMGPRGGEKTALFWLEFKTSCAIYVACVKDPIEEKSPQKTNLGRWI